VTHGGTLSARVDAFARAGTLAAFGVSFLAIPGPDEKDPLVACVRWGKRSTPFDQDTAIRNPRRTNAIFHPNTTSP